MGVWKEKEERQENVGERGLRTVCQCGVVNRKLEKKDTVGICG